MGEVETQLSEALQDEVGAALRIVGWYKRSQYELDYIREDLTEDYSEEEIAAAFDQLEIEGIGYSHFPDRFHLGGMDCAMYGFEQALIFQFPKETFAGLVVSVDRDVELNPESLIKTCLASTPADEG